MSDIILNTLIEAVKSGKIPIENLSQEERIKVEEALNKE